MSGPKSLALSLLIVFGMLAPALANSGHNGTEQGLSKNLAAQILGSGSCMGLNWQGGTPNHKALAAANAYFCGSDEGRKIVISFLEGQLKTYMAIGGVSEFETPSHFSWWQAAFSGIWYWAAKNQDAEVLALIRRVMIQQRSLEDAGLDTKGHVVLPGGRCFLGAGEADQRTQRDQGLAIIEGRRVRLPPEVLNSKAAPGSTDRIGVWILPQISRAELDVVAKAPAEMPSTLDAVQIQRSATGGVAWVDQFSGLRPCWWAKWGPEGESYGSDPSLPKGAPGGKRPASIVPPTAGAPVRVWHLGAK
jgi:hypothetical protein